MQELEPRAWGVVQKEYDKDEAAAFATLLAVGSGMLGLRASEPEDAGRLPATLLVAGLFSRRLHPRTQTNPDYVLADPEFFKKPPEEQDFFLEHPTFLPDPLSISLKACGKEFHPSAATAYERSLDFKTATVMRKVTWQLAEGTTLEIDLRYFTSMDKPNLVVMRYAVRAAKGGADVELTSGLSRTEQHDSTLEKDADVGEYDGGIYFSGKSVGSGIGIAEAAAQTARGPSGELAPEIKTGQGGIAQKFTCTLAAGEEIVVEKVVAITTDEGGGDYVSLAKDNARDGLAEGLAALASGHEAQWEERWHDCDIEVDGDVTLQQGIRFSIYHLLIVEPPEGRSVSIGARTLSGLGYRGMVFWDTEVFIVPMFQYTRPEAALRLLQYRGRRIEPMRELARGIGCTGARAPWESNQDGSEGTEPWTRHHRTQLHVTAGIGLGIYRYVASTGDIEALKDGLLELMLESSRFWTSRVTRKGDGYQLLAVCGPDEDHPVVDNNFYTSSFVRWYLRATKELLAEARAAMPEFVDALIKRINLTDAELVEWEQVAENIFIQKPGDDSVIEQFEGYFKLPRGSKDERTPDADQTIKQPDTVMFLRLFPDAYPAEVIKANHLFYEDRTVHGSSLGAGAMALVAGRLGMVDPVRKYLKYAARMDLDARHGSGAGVHSACCGVVYSAVAEGIAGVRLLRDSVVVNPVPHPGFSKVALNFRWHGKQVHFEMSDGKASLGALFDDGEVPIVFHGKEHVLRAGETLRLGL